MLIHDDRKSFETANAPALCLIDPNGNRHKVASTSLAAHAIGCADVLKMVAGDGRLRWAHEKAESLINVQDELEDVRNGENPVFILFYRSHAGTPSRGEILRAARVIARSELKVTDDESETQYITGTRSTVFPEIRNARNDAVTFLVSQMVFFNDNRVTAYPGVGDPGQDQPEMQRILDDINARLTEGSVSMLR